MPSRVKTIEAMLRRNPDDVFLHYSLGMERVAGKEYPRAIAAFRRCLELDSDYLPARVELGKCLRASGDLAAARDIFTAAAELAGRKGEYHTQRYILQQLEGLPKQP